ncbi:MAG: OB-fold domain-containing protein [Pseudomonadota bacterium]
MWSQSESIYRIAAHSTAKAWRNRLGRYRLVGTHCTSCGRDDFPGRYVCPGCHSRELEPKTFSRRGKVVCTAVDHSPLMGHGEDVPKPFAVIELDGGPCLITDIVECEPEDLKEGLRVELVLRKWRRETNGNYMYGYKFCPVIEE